MNEEDARNKKRRRKIREKDRVEGSEKRVENQEGEG